eukprot:gnl/TRDRNA2_/TRDRNA2_32969_c0_seq1.p1 gnl/TRDRNA2_/TRDRNA2_32969_c0~~gnl/TRDRNA2_/TRDRNA2_32969_c0_seq1.p1  ORF type:complete len:164 (-),score=10.38 gnl/TRDRNA2_/TRDRNA2_32969_c0_seq1:57-548(-)
MSGSRLMNNNLTSSGDGRASLNFYDPQNGGGKQNQYKMLPGMPKPQAGPVKPHRVKMSEQDPFALTGHRMPHIFRSRSDPGLDGTIRFTRAVGLAATMPPLRGTSLSMGSPFPQRAGTAPAAIGSKSEALPEWMTVMKWETRYSTSRREDGGFWPTTMNHPGR